MPRGGSAAATSAAGAGRGRRRDGRPGERVQQHERAALEQMDELRSQRVELERSVQRIGEAFASGLDRQACSRSSPRRPSAPARPTYGVAARRPRRRRGRVRASATTGRSAKRSARPSEQALATAPAAEEDREAAYALASAAQPLGRRRSRSAAMTIARRGPPFDAAEREMLRYLSARRRSRSRTSICTSSSPSRRSPTSSPGSPTSGASAS